MKIREHRGSLADSMATEAVIEPTEDALAKYISDKWGVSVDPTQLNVDYYGYDDRISWKKVFLVSVFVGTHREVFGFCDEDVFYSEDTE